MQITRQRIIAAISERFESHPHVYALWLEGADATGAVDQFSDIDFWFDVEDDAVETVFGDVEALLASISLLDHLSEVELSHPKLRHKIYHLENTSEFLKLDVVLQCHSRAPEESTYVSGDPIEALKVIFDKAGVIRFIDAEEIDLRQTLRERINHLEDKFSHLGVRRYLARDEFIEAMAYYQRYVIEPLIELLRIQHTPLHHDYGPVHISRHLPSGVIAELEELYKITSAEDLRTKIYTAEDLFKHTLAMLRGSEEHEYAARKI